MIDPTAEQLVKLNSGGLVLPDRPSKSSLYRYATIGKKSKKTGEIVILETVQMGSRIYTSVCAYERFINALNGIDSTLVQT